MNDDLAVPLFNLDAGVNDDLAVPLFNLDAGGYGNCDEELPAWIEPLLRRLGLEGVNQ